MSLKKRHMGRRVAGVGVGVALMVLGLQAPAFAATTVTAFTPSNGPADCVMVITGTGFLASPEADTDVNFLDSTNAIADTADDYFVISDTEIWAAVPGGLTTGDSYTIRVDNLTGTGTASTTGFLLTTAAGACAPTVTSFAPACASVGDVVVITGTNLLADVGGGDVILGGDVFFNPYDTGTPAQSAATHVVPDVDDATTLNVIVPSGAKDGPLKVDTGVGSAIFSTTSFLTPPPDCVPVTGNEHARSISFKIKKSGKTSGVVSSTEDPAFTDCVAAVPVKIQRKTKSGWKTVGKTTTTDTGSYTKKVKNPKGKQKFRALAPKVSLGDPVTDVCLKAKSATRKA